MQSQSFSDVKCKLMDLWRCFQTQMDIGDAPLCCGGFGGKNLSWGFIVWLSRPPPPLPLSVSLWTCQPQSPALINHWRWASTLLGSAQFAQASLLNASASGGWSPSCAPALARGARALLGMDPHTLQANLVGPAFLHSLYLCVCVCVCEVHNLWPASHKYRSFLVYVHLLSLCTDTPI